MRLRPITEDTQRSSLKSLLLFMRFGTYEPKPDSKPILNYTSIAKSLNMAISSVRHHIIKELEARSADSL